MSQSITQKELLQQTGLTSRQLKNWEQHGVIPTPIDHKYHGWREGQDAIYDIEALERIQAIQKYHYSSITSKGIKGLFHLLYLECFSFPELYEKEKAIIEQSFDSGLIKEMRGAVREEKNEQAFVDKSEAIQVAINKILGKYVPPNERKLIPQINEEVQRIGLAKILGENQGNLKEDIRGLPDDAFKPNEILEPLMELLNQNGYALSEKDQIELVEEIAKQGRYTLDKFPDNYKWRNILNKITNRELKQIQILLQFFPSRDLIWRPEMASTLLNMYITLKMPTLIQQSAQPQELNEEVLDVALLMFRKIKVGKIEEALKMILSYEKINTKDKELIINLFLSLHNMGIIPENIIGIIREELIL